MTDSTDVFLRTGAFYFGGGQTRVRTLLGSCVAITVWHPRLRIGGMCHYLLPKPPARDAHTQMLGMYAEGALQLFMQEIARAQTVPDDYVVKVFGGGSMFSQPSGMCPSRPCTAATRAGCRDIPCRNVESGRALLKGQGFSITVEHVGGAGSRQIVFDLQTGDVWMRRGPEISGSS